MTGLGRLRWAQERGPLQASLRKNRLSLQQPSQILGVVLQQNQHISHLPQVPAQIRRAATRTLRPDKLSVLCLILQRTRQRFFRGGDRSRQWEREKEPWSTPTLWR